MNLSRIEKQQMQQSYTKKIEYGLKTQGDYKRLCQSKDSTKRLQESWPMATQ